MIKKKAHGLLAQSVAMVVFVTFAVSCTKWQTQPFPAAAIVNDKHPSTIRVTLHNGIRAEIDRPRIEGDSLVGVQFVGGQSRQRSVALDDIWLVETRVVDAGKTTLAAHLAVEAERSRGGPRGAGCGQDSVLGFVAPNILKSVGTHLTKLWR